MRRESVERDRLEDGVDADDFPVLGVRRDVGQVDAAFISRLIGAPARRVLLALDDVGGRAGGAEAVENLVTDRLALLREVQTDPGAILLLDVPKYDFNWQLYYELVTPRKIPAGSKVTVVSLFDNSTSNRYNPAPEKEVFWSEQSWDEMYAPQARITVDGRPLSKTAATAPQQR